MTQSQAHSSPLESPAPFQPIQNQVETWFKYLQTHICTVLEEIEAEFSSENNHKNQFKTSTWKRTDSTQANDDGGGGTIRLMQNGHVFEKAGVNISTVFGQFSKQFQGEIPGTKNDPSFWASGISLVIHPLNPFVPAVHMNTRHIITEESWFGGGADLTPCLPFEEDTNDFHHALKKACDDYAPDAYVKYKEWCDKYFFLPHRNEMRGVGGIFFDYLKSDNQESEFNFLKNVGIAFINVYAKIVRKRMHLPWSEEDKNIQLIKRGRYAEFNLLYDRGTRFGLMTNGNTEAILMSLPPHATWSTSLGH